MIVVDLNVLIYAVDEDSYHHTAAKAWLEKQLNGTESIGIPWVVLLGFLRIMTSRKVFSHPLTEDQTIEIIDQWLTHPLVRIPNPEHHHWFLMKELVLESGTAGNLTSDIHLAAIAMQSRAKLYTLDADFSRFNGLWWEKPF
ncbi:MAG: type II toxin-antitoxin system VapC family toxin [Spirochaetes bacterium]|nr:type II toxin-antitoxin system VapC family toxin [Spirochaetota bacterium]MBL7006734.1 type II toxin-antitoxin system VapC family toxin [Spirochaetia bacterium]